MRTGRRIAICCTWAITAVAVYLALATGVSQGIVLLVFVGSFLPYVLWLLVEPYLASDRTPPPDVGVQCRRCNRPVLVDPVRSRDVFEGMHWLCFHLEFEHEGDPDLPCADPSCPQWRLQVYENGLRELGVSPEDVMARAIDARFR